MMNKVSGFRKYGHNLGPLDGMGIHWGGGGGEDTEFDTEVGFF